MSMKRWSVVAGLLAAAGIAWAAQGAAINKICPVKGEPIKPGNTTVYKNKTIGFC